MLLFSAFGPGALSLHARGTQENLMAEAQELFNQKRYDEATKVLIKVIEVNPDRLDEAEALLGEIRRIRRELNQKNETILDEFNKGNLESAKAKLNEAQALDPNPNQFAKQTFRQTTLAINQAYARKVFAKIMEEGAVLLADGKYGEAARIYLTGYDFMIDEFRLDEEGKALFEPGVYEAVERAKTDLRAAANAFIAQEAAFLQAATDGQTALAAGSNLRPALNNQLNRLEALAALRRRVWAAWQEFSTRDKVLAARQNLPVIPHLDFNRQVTKGRDTAAQPEGLLEALDLPAKKALTAWSDSLKQRTDELVTAVQSALTKEDFAAAQTNLAALADTAGAGLDVVGWWNRETAVFDTGLDKDGLTLIRAHLGQLEYYRLRLGLAAAGQRLLTIRRTAEGLVAKPAVNRAAVEQDRLSVETGRRELVAYQQELSDRRTYLQTLGNLKISGLDAAPLLVSLSGLWKNYSDRSAADAITLLDRRGALDYAAFPPAWDSLLAAVEDINKNLIEGEQKQEGEVFITLRYPSQALRRFETESVRQNALEKGLTDFIAAYQAEAPEIRDAAPIRKWVGQAEDLLAQVRALKQRTARLVAQAQADQGKAYDLRQAAELSSKQVENAIERADYKIAKTRYLEDFRVQSRDSLALQEDPVYRQDRADRLKRYSDTIQRLYGQQIINEVRALIEKSWDSYNLGRFSPAATTLEQARTRWQETNVESNPEVDYLFDLVREALSGSSGIELAATDPLYHEIQQLLNFARNDYDTALLMRDNGQTAEMNKALTRASDNIRRVLAAFARNQEARRLQLLILKINNQTAYKENFQSALESAQAKLNASTEAQIKQGKKELDLLVQIDPKFPGLAAAVQAFEDKINAPLRDAENRQRAGALVAQAQRIVDNNQVGQYANALNLLNQAAILDRGNRAIGRLIDEIRRKQTVVAAPVEVGLNDNEKEALTRAEALYASGVSGNAADLIQANQIVEGLWSRAKNQGDKGLRKLRNNIRAALGL